MEPIFLNDWAESQYKGDKIGLEGLKDDFEITDDDLQGVEILLASYSYECYSGDAFVLFRKDGKYYEVNGGHCSCYGLEGQWEPEETDLESIKHRLENGTLGSNEWCGNVFAEELNQLIGKLKEG